MIKGCIPWLQFCWIYFFPLMCNTYFKFVLGHFRFLNEKTSLWYILIFDAVLNNRSHVEAWIFYPRRLEVLIELIGSEKFSEKSTLKINAWSPIYKSESTYVYLVVWTNSVNNFNNFMKYFPFNQHLKPSSLL